MPQIDASAIAGAIADLVTERSHSIRAAGASIGVDRKTLGGRIEGGLSRRNSHFNQQVLTPIQEELLGQWILQLETQGYAPTPKKREKWRVKYQDILKDPILLERIGYHAFSVVTQSFGAKLGERLTLYEFRIPIQPL